MHRGRGSIHAEAIWSSHVTVTQATRARWLRQGKMDLGDDLHQILGVTRRFTCAATVVERRKESKRVSADVSNKLRRSNECGEDKHPTSTNAERLSSSAHSSSASSSSAKQQQRKQQQQRSIRRVSSSQTSHSPAGHFDELHVDGHARAGVRREGRFGAVDRQQSAALVLGEKEVHVLARRLKCGLCLRCWCTLKLQTRKHAHDGAAQPADASASRTGGERCGNCGIVPIQERPRKGPAARLRAHLGRRRRK